MPKFSIIIPVYNMEKYLMRALMSIKEETFTDYEVLIVDDGSTDKSPQMIDEFAAKDERFIPVHKPNGGVASARNMGLDRASGEYILFVDPDDKIEKGALTVLGEGIDKHSPGLIIFGTYNDYLDESLNTVASTTSIPSFPGFYDESPCRRYFSEIVCSYLVTSKCFKRELIEGYKTRFRDLSLGEDGMFFADFYENEPESMLVIDKALYHVTIARRNSLSNSYHPERFDQAFILSKKAREIINKWGLNESPEHVRSVDYATVRDVQMLIKNLSLSPEDTGSCVRRLRNCLNDREVLETIKRTPASLMGSRNDRIKLMLLKMKLYAPVVMLARLNRKR
ncbi:MAG: glycosyltransferase family 2 protein [Eubacteriales bacterium]|nr:glycosyltransferase family 2 protein [Eubacteriales bacterium]